MRGARRNTRAGPHQVRSHAHPPATLPSVVHALTIDTPAVATPIEAPCENSSAAACEMTIRPEETPNPSVAQSTAIAGRSVASRACCSGEISSFLSRLGSAIGVSSPPALSIRKRGTALESNKKPIHRIAYPTPPTSSRCLTTGANRNAPAARALVTKPTLTPSPNALAVEIWTLKPYPTPAALPNKSPYPTNRGATDTSCVACDAHSIPSPATVAATAAIVAGLALLYTPGPIFATAIVNATVVAENTHERTPRPTCSTCSRGIR
mmetsp:Transcript_4828/g.17829  ORF Transcript_4828/g.17829 Transcript_4828/m.17829 type:complete len:266 (-) Transcript_4828:603-1400(-)